MTRPDTVRQLAQMDARRDLAALRDGVMDSFIARVGKGVLQDDDRDDYCAAYLVEYRAQRDADPRFGSGRGRR